MRTSLLTRQQLQEPVLRSILGEVKDPLDTYVSTIADLAEFKATNDYYDYLAKNFVDVDDAAGAASRRDLLLSEEAAALLPKIFFKKNMFNLATLLVRFLMTRTLLTYLRCKVVTYHMARYKELTQEKTCTEQEVLQD